MNVVDSGLPSQYLPGNGLYFYFIKILRLQNKLPSFDLSQSLSLKRNVYKYLHQHFILHFSGDNPCTYFFVADVAIVIMQVCLAISQYFSFVIKFCI